MVFEHFLGVIEACAAWSGMPDTSTGRPAAFKATTIKATTINSRLLENVKEEFTYEERY